MSNSVLNISIDRWAPIVGYEGLYEISDLGRVKALPKLLCNRNDKHGIAYRKTKELMLKHAIDSKGYPFVCLHKDKRQKMHRIHRLIATHFMPNKDNLKEVNHKNGIKTDYSISNLEWCSHRQNIQHAWDIGLNKATENFKGVTGEGHHAAKKVIQLSRDSEKIKEYGCISDAARDHKILTANICKVCMGKAKSAGGYLWKYAS